LNELVLDLSDLDPSERDDEGEDTDQPDSESEPADEAGEDAGEATGKGVRAGILYDEWNGIREEYYKDWCLLRERLPAGDRRPAGIEPPSAEDAARIKNLFERVKPEMMRKEKYLYEGDAINIDRLIEYITLRRANVYGNENFYEKTLVRKRDLAVSLLIDISGSTGSEVEDQVKVLDIEKRAAAVLSEGLSLLGDQFALYGFTGNGRENCEFFIFKDFTDAWDADTRDRLFGVYPGTSTRIGVALRHAGVKLAATPARRRLMLLVTDGKPMDSEYDPNTGYAYLDVRKACHENTEKGIDTFAIITDHEQKEVLTQMFPRSNFLVISNIRELPHVLPSFFLHLTT
jgi:nitric oxide reductase activation protein